MTMKPQTAEHVTRWREAHHKSLAMLASQINPHNKLTGLQLWRKLCKIERKASSGAVAYCNGATCHTAHTLTSTKQRLVWNFNADENAWESFSQWIEAKVAKVFGGVPQGFFVNGDPRGYALKLDNEKVTIPDGMHKDFGGYGILAAVIVKGTP